MTDALDTTSLLAQLAAHRATLAVLLRQLANLGADYAPPGVHNGIAEARREIARLKAVLRAAGVEVDDLPGDEAATDELPQAPRRSERQHQLDVGGSAQLGVATAGDIHGSITVNYGAAPAPPPIDPAAAQTCLAALPLDVVPAPALLPPGSRMPLSVNPLFVGRGDDLKALAATLKAGTTTVIAAAIGMGGVGKTQLASEFAHRYGQYFLGGVFWLSFADPAGVAAEIAACGAALELPGFAALAISEQVLGPQHPDTASSLNNLAVLLDNQGDYAGARPLYERALAIREQVLGPQHPDTRTTRADLAALSARTQRSE